MGTAPGDRLHAAVLQPHSPRPAREKPCGAKDSLLGCSGWPQPAGTKRCQSRWPGGEGETAPPGPVAQRGPRCPAPTFPPLLWSWPLGALAQRGREPHGATRHHVAAVCTGKTERPMVTALPRHWEKGGCDPQMGGGSCQRWGRRKKEPVLPAGGAGNRGSPCRSSTGHGAGDGEGRRAACMAGQPDPMCEGPPRAHRSPPPASDPPSSARSSPQAGSRRRRCAKRPRCCDRDRASVAGAVLGDRTRVGATRSGGFHEQQRATRGSQQRAGPLP